MIPPHHSNADLQMGIAAKISYRRQFLINLVSFYYYYLRSHCFHRKVKKKETDGFVFFNIQSKVSERHFAYLLYCFNVCNVPIKLRNNGHFIGNLNSYCKQIATLTNLKIVDKNPNPLNCLLLISDVPDPIVNLSYPKVVQLDLLLLKNGEFRNSHEIMPFFMIPRMYFSGIYKQAELLRANEKRKMRVFFSGNLNPKQYNNQKLKTLFNKLTRIEIINVLKKELASRDITTLDDVGKLELTNYVNKVVLSVWARKSIKQTYINGRIENYDWLRVLSFVDFFMACPGFIQPMCHNVIEAMSVGAIPILEHPEFFNPPLEHGVNSIVFSGEQDLVFKTKELLTLEYELIKKMRKNVLDYYNNFLAPEAVVKNILKGKKTDMCLIESASFVDMEMY